ncbi:hypothetical protein EFL95_03450 [Nocardioides marmorisolisilvae]|uniref:Lipoprotein n=1 Tax=Nocardioides marmorisolisilvae TaxID=1542737 RepID=A0A3N0E0M1_9ACTN|nr:hypothetical protein EFL95_03450 [Nocardioides marmorisolisilvae]
MRNLSAIALLVASLALTGCGGKTVTTSDGSKVHVDGNGDGATIKTDDGEITVGKGLPDGFPKDDVPVVDGTIIGGSKGTDTGPYAWSVVVQSDGDASDVFGDAKSKLEGAGFTAGQNMDMGEVHTGQFTSAKYEVSVNAAKTGSTVTVTYLVRVPPAS